MAAVPSLERAVAGIKTRATIDFLRDSPKKLLINGQWVAAKSGKTFESINPANEEILALIAEGDKADVDAAVTSARRAFDESKWSSITPHQRSRYLYKIADLIEQNADQLAELESLDNGKPLAIAKLADIPGAARTFRYYAGWPTKIYGETNPSDPIDVQLHDPRTGWGLRTNNSLELSALDGLMEGRAGVGLWQYDRA